MSRARVSAPVATDAEIRQDLPREVRLETAGGVELGGKRVPGILDGEDGLGCIVVAAAVRGERGKQRAWGPE